MEKRFNALRIIGTIFKVLAWIILVLGVLLTVIFFVIVVIGGVAASNNNSNMGPLMAGGVTGIILAVIYLVVTVTYFLFLYGVGEAIFLALAIEENTRETSLLLRNSQQPQYAPPPPPKQW